MEKSGNFTFYNLLEPCKIASDLSQFPRFSAYIYIIVLVLNPKINYEIIISQSSYLKGLGHRHNILSFSDAGKSTIGGQIL